MTDQAYFYLICKKSEVDTGKWFFYVNVSHIL
jgi:hypothetical protein